jgi:hypothetical protein
MIKATVKGGRLELDVPVDWPDGIEVEVYPLEPGIQDDSETISAEEIAQTLAAMDQVEPLEITAAERAACEADREARIRREKTRFAEHAEDRSRESCQSLSRTSFSICRAARRARGGPHATGRFLPGGCFRPAGEGLIGLAGPPGRPSAPDIIRVSGVEPDG